MKRKISAAKWDEKAKEGVAGANQFFMGEDGVANFEKEEDAEEDRTWERKSRRSRMANRNRSRGAANKQTHFVSRGQYDKHYDKVAGVGGEGGEGGEGGDDDDDDDDDDGSTSSEFDLLSIANAAKAETVAACLAEDSD
ncbi:hypothetical protein ScalyP_jg2127 [Parmales sp. scaly parma]|nr:hypothetical protein ScalyP_jg2127 [Parmales sp. scaly parma]